MCGRTRAPPDAGAGTRRGNGAAGCRLAAGRCALSRCPAGLRAVLPGLADVTDRSHHRGEPAHGAPLSGGHPPHQRRRHAPGPARKSAARHRSAAGRGKRCLERGGARTRVRARAARRQARPHEATRHPPAAPAWPRRASGDWPGRVGGARRGDRAPAPREPDGAPARRGPCCPRTHRAATRTLRAAARRPSGGARDADAPARGYSTSSR